MPESNKPGKFSGTCSNAIRLTGDEPHRTNHTRNGLRVSWNPVPAAVAVSGSIPNYGQPWRNGEVISTSFVASAVNVPAGKLFCKKQQMQWTPEGARILLRTRARTLDGALRGMFEKWYPGMAANFMLTGTREPLLDHVPREREAEPGFTSRCTKE